MLRCRVTERESEAIRLKCVALSLQGNSISSFSREKLEKLFADSVRKLRAKEKELVSVSSERDALAQQLSQGQDTALGIADLQAKLQASLVQTRCCACWVDALVRSFTRMRAYSKSSKTRNTLATCRRQRMRQQLLRTSF